jgi:hypothetical protein
MLKYFKKQRRVRYLSNNIPYLSQNSGIKTQRMGLHAMGRIEPLR